MQKPVIKYILVLVYAGTVLSALTIPFFFESPSLFYKTGSDKILLRTGKIFGILAAVLMMFQPLFVSRMKWLENIFGLKYLWGLHRKTGLIILGIALAHPVFILGADHFVFFPIEPKYWPEFTGVALLVMLAFFVLVAHWQNKTGLSYKTWKRLHGITAPVILGLTAVHVLNASRSFEAGVPFWAMVILLGFAGFFMVWKTVKK